MVHLFGECELDRDLHTLRRRGREVRVEPEVFDLLAFLMDHRERMVPERELLDALWPGETVSESRLPRSITAARRAVGDDRVRQCVIATDHGRGYRFVAEVRVVSPAPAVAGRGRAATARRCETLLHLAEASDADGAWDRARDRFREAAALARSLARSDLLARAALGMRRFGEMGAPADAETLGLMEEALAALGDAHPALRARLLGRLSGTPPRAASMAAREALSREAWELACLEDDVAAERDALAARYWAALGPDRVEERLAVAREARKRAERWNEPRLELLACEIAFGAGLLVGDMEAAHRELAVYLERAEALGELRFLYRGRLMEGSVALVAGRLDEAADHFAAGFALARDTVPHADAVYAGQRYLLFYMRGDAAAFIESTAGLRDTFGERFAGIDAPVRATTALALAMAGRSDEARRELEALAGGGLDTLPRDENWLLTTAALADLAILVEDERRATALYDLLLPYARLHVVHDLLHAHAGSVASVLGELALFLGRDDDAVTHLERAVAAEEAMGAVPALVTSRAALVLALELRGAPGDGARAEALRREGELPR